MIVSAYAFIRSLQDKYTLGRWPGHAWYYFSHAILHAFLVTCLDFIIHFSVNLIIIICFKTSNGFVLFLASLVTVVGHSEEILLLLAEVLIWNFFFSSTFYITFVSIQ